MDQDLRLLLGILQKDSRFSLEAFLFVREALAYAADQLALDCCREHEDEPHECQKPKSKSKPKSSGANKTSPRRHVTGQELCDGIRQYALNQFGYMSKTVLNSWGLHSTSDIGEVVYKMINAGIMKKSSRDRRSHFDDVFDFDEAFEQQYDFACHASLAKRP